METNPKCKAWWIIKKCTICSILWNRTLPILYSTPYKSLQRWVLHYFSNHRLFSLFCILFIWSKSVNSFVTVLLNLTSYLWGSYKLLNMNTVYLSILLYNNRPLCVSILPFACLLILLWMDIWVVLGFLVLMDNNVMHILCTSFAMYFSCIYSSNGVAGS